MDRPTESNQEPEIEHRADVLRLGPTMADDEVAALRAELVELLARSQVRVVPCCVSASAPPDLSVLEALARLQLTAKRLGRAICVLEPGDDLVALLGLTGLSGALSVQREAEVGELLDIEEGVQPDDAQA
jgi:hypothetical protein